MAITVSKLKVYAKVAVGAATLILAWLNDHMDLVPVQYRGYVTGVIGLLGLLGIYHAPYVPKVSVRRSVKRSGPRKQVGTSQVPIVRDVPGKHEK